MSRLRATKKPVSTECTAAPRIISVGDMVDIGRSRRPFCFCAKAVSVFVSGGLLTAGQTATLTMWRRNCRFH